MLPVRIPLTAGQEADATQAEELIEGLPIEVVIGDEDYDSDKLVGVIEDKGAKAVIPPRSNRTEQREYDEEQYEDRNLGERFWQKIKQFRRVATRYEKTARNFLAFVHVASSMVLLR
jgi:transposase